MLVECPECKRQISDTAAACPNCGFARGSTPPVQPQSVRPKARAGSTIGCGTLVVVALVIGWIFSDRHQYTPPASSTDGSASTLASTPDPAAAQPAGDQLALLSYRCSREAGSSIETEGSVKNISADALKNVEAVASYTGADGSIVTSDSALIEYNPVLPGQVSPFKVITTYNPAIAHCAVAFKDLMGGTIATSYDELSKPNPKRTRKRKSHRKSTTPD